MNKTKLTISNGILRNSMFEPNNIDCTVYEDRDNWNKNSAEFKRRYPKENPNIKKAISPLDELSYNKELISELL